MACIINACVVGVASGLVLTPISPSADYVAWYPALQSADVQVDGGVAISCVLEISTDGGSSWATLVTLSDFGGGLWSENFDLSLYAEGIYVLRFAANDGTTDYYSFEMNVDLRVPPTVVVSAPSAAFILPENGSSAVEVYLEDTFTVSNCYLDIYLEGSYVDSVVLAYDSSSGGYQYFSGTMTHPAAGSGYVIGRVVIVANEFSSDSVSGTFASMGVEITSPSYLQAIEEGTPLAISGTVLNTDYVTSVAGTYNGSNVPMNVIPGDGPDGTFSQAVEGVNAVFGVNEIYVTAYYEFAGVTAEAYHTQTIEVTVSP